MASNAQRRTVYRKLQRATALLEEAQNHPGASDVDGTRWRIDEAKNKAIEAMRHMERQGF